MVCSFTITGATTQYHFLHRIPAMPSTRSTTTRGDELKSLIKALKENGIEVILDVVFNHTAEGNEMGPCFSFKGIDNNVYYMLTPDAHYYNFSGCGNVMNCKSSCCAQLLS